LEAAHAAERQLNIVTRTQPLNFARGDELARIPVRNRLSAAEAKSYLLALIGQASSLAKSNGAVPAASGSEAVLAPRDNGNRTIGEDEIFQELVSKIAM